MIETMCVLSDNIIVKNVSDFAEFLIIMIEM